jgi:hypothetical protein
VVSYLCIPEVIKEDIKDQFPLTSPKKRDPNGKLIAESGQLKARS